MSLFSKIGRILIHISAITLGTIIIAFAGLVFSRLVVHTTPVEAASIIYYPNFCLGGWKYPQHASGPAAVSDQFDTDNFNIQNSAYLESSVASQLFCGYFSVRNSKNPPTKAVIKFNWSFIFGGDSATTTKPDSYTNVDSKLSPISPDTGFIISPTSTNAVTSGDSNLIPVSDNLSATSSNEVPNTQTNSTSSESNTMGNSDSINVNSTSTTEIQMNSNQGTTDQIDNLSNPSANPGSSTSDTNSTPNSLTSDQTTTPNPPPATETIPAQPSGSSSDATGGPNPSSDPSTDGAPQSFDNIRRNLRDNLLSLFVGQVYAAETDEVIQSPLSADAFKDFLEVSYSLDGIRWTMIGRVNKDNWKDFSVEVPVSSWDEVKRLQIMVSALPTIDEKPDIYLDSISMRAEYKQTVAELAASGLAAVTNAVDVLIGDGNGPENAFEIIPEKKEAPKPVEIRKKKLLFSTAGSVITLPNDIDDADDKTVRNKTKLPHNITINPSPDGSSFRVSGNCARKYFVILTYKNQSDYLKKTSSFIANEARECVNGSFSYDLASLSPELRSGAQYLLVGEQDETSPWRPISDLYPIMIQSTTTVERVYPEQ